MQVLVVSLLSFNIVPLRKATGSPIILVVIVILIIFIDQDIIGFSSCFYACVIPWNSSTSYIYIADIMQCVLEILHKSRSTFTFINILLYELITPITNTSGSHFIIIVRTSNSP